MLLDISFLYFRSEGEKDFESDSREKSTTSFTSKFMNPHFLDFLNGMIGN